jgi:aspartate ammonia-lyase
MHRLERDPLGEHSVPADAYYGIQTQRAAENFPISGLRAPDELITATILVKKAAAAANMATGQLPHSVGNAIIAAADEILAGQLRDQFVVDVYQAGAGTSHNMNANEVLANRAAEILGLPKGVYTTVHPNDHVNMSQSTNDVFPTATRIALLLDHGALVESAGALRGSLAEKARQFGNVLKVGRTHLQDAVPITLGEVFGGYAACIERATNDVDVASTQLAELNLGATAVGTGLNASIGYAEAAVEHLRSHTRLPLRRASNLFRVTQSMGDVAAYSGAMRRLSIELGKIASDLRLLSMGPRAGLSEIALPAVQPGSSIMPGKVNPVIPEVVNQTSFLVIGLDVTVTLAASAGQLQLNVMEPVITFALFASIATMERAVNSLRVNCIQGITANTDRTRDMVLNSLGIVTVLKPSLGYKQCAEIAREGYETGKSLHDIVVKEKKLLTQQKWDEIFSFENLINPKFEQ